MWDDLSSKNLNKDVGSLVQAQTRDNDDNATPGSETIHMENGSRDESNQQRDGHKGEDFQTQACGCADQRAGSQQNKSATHA